MRRSSVRRRTAKRFSRKRAQIFSSIESPAMHVKIIAGLALGSTLLMHCPLVQAEKADRPTEKKWKEAAVAVSAAWLQAWLEKDVDKVMKLSDVPFHIDERELIDDRQVLRQRFQDELDKKPKRKIKVDKGKVLDVDSRGIVRVMVALGGEGIVFTVNARKEAKVIGIRD